MNALAMEFCDPDSVHLDLDTRAEIVRQRLGCDPNRAYNIAKIVQNWAARVVRQKRDADILLDKKNGLSAPQIAKKHNMSRQQVYNIIRKQSKIEIFK